MIGLILVGHGEFGRGLISSVDLIMGEQKHMEYVDFKINHTVEELEDNIKDKVKAMKACDGILFLTDIVGGTPFRVSVSISQNISNSRVLTGVNLPLLLEAIAKRDMKDIEVLKKDLILMGRNGIDFFELERVYADEQVSEGI